MRARRRDVEGPELEWKRRIPRPERVAALFAAFANGVGGRLRVGVGDDGSIVGVPDAAAVRAALLSIADARVRPAVAVTILRTNEAGRVIVDAIVGPSPLRPVRAIRADGRTMAYVRDGDRTRPASRAEEKELAVAAASATRKGGVRLDRFARAVLTAILRMQQPTASVLARTLKLSPRRLRRIVIPLVEAGCLLADETGRLTLTPKGHRALDARSAAGARRAPTGPGGGR